LMFCTRCFIHPILAGVSSVRKMNTGAITGFILIRY
jgi:hypothetical protein